MLLIIVLIIQSPSLSIPGSMGRDGYLIKSTKEVVEKDNSDSADEFQIHYYVNGGDFFADNPVKYTREDLPIALGVPVREGYNFAGWYTDMEFSQKIQMIDQDNIGNMQLYAKWTKVIDGDYSIQMYSYQKATVTDHSDKKLKNCSYSFLNNIEIPGMPSTKESDYKANRIMDTGQCLQGICITKEYLLVSSYSSGGTDELGCIHVFDKSDGEYLATLGMKEESHLGGITYDGKHIWVCHSDNNTLECIPYSFVKEIASDMPKTIVNCSTLFEEYHVSNTPSCIAYYDDKIWVATHTKRLNSMMIAYRITEDGLQQEQSYRIPDKVQGIAFDEEGKVYVSTSYGRKKSSYLRVYASVQELDQKPKYPMIKIEMPPCSEEVDMEDGQIYIVFESAGEKYFEGTDGKGRSVSPIDKVVTVSTESIFQ